MTDRPSLEAPSELQRFGYAKIPTDLPGQMIVDLAVAGNGTTPVQRRVLPPGMARAFPKQAATMPAEVRKQITPLHTAMENSS